MTITIRQAGVEDAPIVARLNDVVQQLHVDVRPERYRALQQDDPARLRHVEQLLARPDAYTFIAEASGEAVGYFVGLFITVENVFLHPQRDFHIDQMAVAEAHQGKGVGHRLMAQAKTTARTLNADRLTLGVASFNEGAIAFYEREGFAISSLKMALPLEAGQESP